jgi:iron(III) transport system permease protein
LAALGALVLALALAPLLFLGVRAAALWGQGPSHEALWAAETGWTALRSLLLSGGVALLAVSISLPLAWITHATDVPGRRVWQALLLLPLAVPSYVGAFVVMAALGQGGWLHEWALRPLFGVEKMPELRGALGATLALLPAYPLALIALQASMARLDPRLWEAARSLGCSGWGAFWRVVFPALRPAMGTGAVLVALYTLGDFGAVSLMRFKALSYVIYLRQGSLSDNLRHEAVYLSWVLVAVSLGLLWLLGKAGGATARTLTAQAGFRAWPVVALGAWRWPAFAACGAVVGLGVVTPLAVLLGWLARGLRLGHELPEPWRELGLTLGLGAAAGALAVLAALVPALWGRFGGRWGGRAVSAASLAGYALPGVVVALSLVAITTSYAFSWYQTSRLLVLAYVVRFLPLAVRTLSESLQAQNPRIYDAARSLGASPLTAWARVVLPAARASLWAGWLGVFLAVIKELPLTLLLGPISVTPLGASESWPFGTLATTIWTFTEDDHFSKVSVPALLLLGLAGAGLFLKPDTLTARPRSDGGTAPP